MYLECTFLPSFRPFMRPHPVTYPALMVHDMTPPLSPTSSVGSTNSPATPIDVHTPIFVGDRTSEGRFTHFENSSEVWEEFKDIGHDSSSVTVADPEILISPSSSLLSGLDLLGGGTVPEVTAVPVRQRSQQTAAPHRESFLDFPSPPTLVPDRRTSFGECRPIGKGLLMASPLSNPSLAVSCDSIPQSTLYPQSSALRRRWSTLPPVEFHPDNRPRSTERVTDKGTDTFWTLRAAVPDIDTPVVSRPGDGVYDQPSPRSRSKRREKTDAFESFIDMSVTESALSASRVQRLFSKISGGFKPRSKRRRY
jgi:hypothetical protein